MGDLIPVDFHLRRAVKTAAEALERTPEQIAVDNSPMGECPTLDAVAAAELAAPRWPNGIDDLLWSI